MKKTTLLILSTMALATNVYAQKVDFNMNGRNANQVTEPGFTPWAMTSRTTEPQPIGNSNIKIAISNGPKYGNENIKTSWWREGVEKKSKLICDGICIYEELLNHNDNKKSQKVMPEIVITLSGLAAGEHSILAYHNNVNGHSTSPIDVYVDGVKVQSGVAQTSRAEKLSECGYSYVKFKAEAGKDVQIAYLPETLKSSVKNDDIKNGLTINAIIIDDQDPKDVALEPYPANCDMHVDADNSTCKLTWKPAAAAVKHHLYIGTSADNMNKVATLKDSYYMLRDVYSMNTYYWRVDEEDAEGNTFRGETWTFHSRHLAFPGAEGYGRYATGGRGGAVYHVTSLDDDKRNPQPGTFRYGITKMSGPRTIVFDVGGVIDLKSRLTCSDPYVTIAGQTAPGNGIMLRSSPFGMASEGITRFLHMFLGHTAVTRNSGCDGLGMAGNNHSIMDHCSISWTIDEAFSSRSAKNVTLQRTMISETLNIAGHPHYKPGKTHGFAATIGGDTGSYHHNLMAHNEGRNWSLSGSLDGDGYYAGHHDIFNNVCYNWGGRATDGGTHECNFVGNYYKMGPATKKLQILNAQLEGTGKGSQSYYVSGNIRENIDGSKSADKFNDTYEYSLSHGQKLTWDVFRDKPFFPSYANIETAEATYKNVLSDVGCNMPTLDNHDLRMVNETLTGTYTTTGSKSGKKGLVDSEEDANCEGFGGINIYEVHREASFDTDGDGMPDWWERAKGLNPNVADNNSDIDKDGYTALEDYLNWMAEPHFTIQKGKKMVINLKEYFAGYNNKPTFSIATNDNITAKCKSNGKCTFSPSKHFTGLVTISVTATDGDNVGKLSRNFNFYISEN